MHNAERILQACIESLTARVNEKGFADAKDISAAITLFKELRRHGFVLVEHDIHRLALLNHWEASSADKVAKLAARIENGDTVRIKHPTSFGATTVARHIAEHQ